ncbi:ribonuclease HII [Actinotignum schaalii]|uniref:ribonuclease HII n=1 Tax=Actinomycetaceae TaxID=2049 RepID=UPI00237D7C95|nr:ribonuclease HII [Actinotignum schaalii]MDE1654003.1 ribonuclease HII [Actinotignum schaalii]
MQEPDRTVEKELLARLEAHGGGILAAVDEVGRGAIAGPVCVGIALLDRSTPDDFPPGLRDSKMLSAHRRETIYQAARDWPLAVAVGSAAASVVDTVGIIEALRCAAADALAQLEKSGLCPDAVLLDGKHNWWAQDSLFDAEQTVPQLPVTTVIKGDASCAGIAAASVVAKVERDRYMEALAKEFPDYDWEHNKGYGTRAHLDAIAQVGPSPYHRTSWHLPAVRSE